MIACMSVLTKIESGFKPEGNGSRGDAVDYNSDPILHDRSTVLSYMLVGVFTYMDHLIGTICISSHLSSQMKARLGPPLCKRVIGLQ